MKAEFLIENIEKYLPSITKILPVNSQVPVLSNILIEAKSSGLYFSATNLEIGIIIKIPAKITEEGATTVPGKQFIEALSTFSKDKVSLSLDGAALSLESRGSKVKFQTISKEDFPRLYEEKGEKIYEFKKGELNSLFSNINFAVSLDEGRPELTGILISPKSGATQFVATDGFRLSKRETENKKILDSEEPLILPSKLVNEALSLKESDIISLFVDKTSNQVIFETEDIILVGRIINGQFPNYERVIPTDSKTKIILDREELIQKIRLISVFARDTANIVQIKVDGDKVKLFSRSAGVGESDVVVEGKQTGEGCEIAFNVKFLNDLLKSLTGKTITMGLSSGVEPAVFTTDDDPGFVHIIMPVRVQE